MDNGFFSPAQAVALYARAGSAKTKRPASQLILLGILAGALIALGSAATNTATYGITDPWSARLICGLLFPFGLAMVVMSGAELFTGNCLIAISVLDRQCGVLGMARNLIIVYLSNLAGALLVAAGCAEFGQMDYSGGLLAVTTMKMAAAKCSLPFGRAFVLAILCNVLVCLGVMLAMTAKDTIGRILGAFLPVSYFVICGFEHCVANMFYIPAGLMAKSVPAYAQLAAEMGIDLSALTWQNFVLANLLPVTLGNLAGGIGLAALLWYCHSDSRQHGNAPERIGSGKKAAAGS